MNTELKELAETLEDKNVYARVYFRVDAGYVWGEGISTEKGNRFDEEVVRLLTSAGFTEEENDMKHIGGCPTMRRGREHLYCHPMDISGQVKVSSIPEISALLGQESNQTFKLRDTDVVSEEYVIFTPEELLRELTKRRDEIKALTLSAYRLPKGHNPKRTYYRAMDVHIGDFPQHLQAKDMEVRDPLRPAAHKVRIDFMRELLEELVNEGNVIKVDNTDERSKEHDPHLYRTATKQELQAATRAKNQTAVTITAEQDIDQEESAAMGPAR